VPDAIICILSEESLEDLVDIEKESGDPPWSRALFEEEFKNQHSKIYGARWQGALVGFLVCQTVLDEGHILNFAVRKACRGQGLGRSLVREVLAELHSALVSAVYLEVRKSNLAARRLYESLGFSEAGVRKDYYRSNMEDGILMRLDLEHFSRTAK
jgi:[ribosomal protein S18]-alanine N-acetyltransferase